MSINSIDPIARKSLMSLKKLTVLVGLLGFVVGFIVNQNLLPAIGWGVTGFLGAGIVIAIWTSIADKVRARRKPPISE